jgi:hypothetical protein
MVCDYCDVCLAIEVCIMITALSQVDGLSAESARHENETYEILTNVLADGWVSVYLRLTGRAGVQQYWCDDILRYCTLGRIFAAQSRVSKR